MSPLLARFSTFRAKLLLAMLGSITLVLLAVLLTVQRETSRQLDLVTQRAAEQARRGFAELEELKRAELTQLSRAFTESRRTLAALEAALEAGEHAWLEANIRYELELKRVPSSLAAFTDAFGTTVLTIVDGRRVGDDPGGVGPLALQLFDGEAQEALAYRLVRDRLFLVQVAPLQIAGHLIGTVGFGLPLEDSAAARLAQVVGAEVCFVAGGRCVAGTTRAKADLHGMITESPDRTRWQAQSTDGARWAFFSDPLGADASHSWRVLAVPLDAVLAPFDRIRQILLFTGLAALILVLVLSVLLSRRLSRPIHALVAATGRIAAGDYHVQVASGSRDEFDVLARSFNTMAEGLLLKERYRGVLDKVVSREVADDLLKGEIRLGGENRRVATLFADIRSFTPLVAGMEPQRVIALLNECMGRLGTAVEAEGGIVDKYLGDGMMAIFGAPVGNADDTLRAIRAGLRMLSAVQELNEQRKGRGEPPIHLAIGINSGVVVAGNVGSSNRLNYTVLGDAVNLASRLCGAAGANQILVSRDTLDVVRDEVVCTALGERELKGIAQPVPVYQVTALRGVAAGSAAYPLRSPAEQPANSGT